MKAKTIRKILLKKINEWLATVEDESLRADMKREVIVTGGAIASMLLNEKVNDFDVYFKTKETTKAVAEYYVSKFPYPVKVQELEDRIRIVTERGHRGETMGEQVIQDSGEIEDLYEEAQGKAEETEDKTYRPVFMSTNAITLSNRVQIVIRFFGEPDQIHENYDFVHCTNYLTASNDKLVLKLEALEALLSKELRYVGSRYPLCSIIRLRKFIARGWTVNAGQILKMAMQLDDLDLKDVKVLEDQLTGVDSAYFCEVISKLREKDPEKLNSAYLVEIIDRMF
jgi:hypothetical protein